MSGQRNGLSPTVSDVCQSLRGTAFREVDLVSALFGLDRPILSQANTRTRTEPNRNTDNTARYWTAYGTSGYVETGVKAQERGYSELGIQYVGLSEALVRRDG